MIKAKSQFKRRSTATNVEISIPVPSDADSGQFKATTGAVRYAPENNTMTWSIKSFAVRTSTDPWRLSTSSSSFWSVQGGKEFLMRAHFKLPSVENENQEGRPPIQVKFEIPYFTTSGIQVRIFIFSDSNRLCRALGSLFENRREERLWSIFLGSLHDEKWRLSNTHSIVVDWSFASCSND